MIDEEIRNNMFRTIDSDNITVNIGGESVYTSAPTTISTDDYHYYVDSLGVLRCLNENGEEVGYEGTLNTSVNPTIYTSNLCEVATGVCSRCCRETPMFDLYHNVTSEYEHLCLYCVNELGIHICDRCGIRVSNDRTLCRECDEYLEREREREKMSDYNHVLSYHHFQDWQPKYAKNEAQHNLITGIELEVEHTCNWEYDEDDTVTELNKMLGFNTICSHDGSIDNGFEIVSQPFSLNFLRENEEKVKEALKFLIDRGYRGDQVSTCGLHIHINRKAFGENKEEQDNNINKLILFFETYKEELTKFSRRSQIKLKRWAQFLSDYKNINVDEDSDKSKQLKSLFYIDKLKSAVPERYFAINLMNENTVEVRIFKSSLNYKTLFASIELIHTLVRRIMKYKKLKKIDWNSVVNDSKCKYLKDYVELRQIHTDKELIDNSEWYKNYIVESKKEKFYKMKDRFYVLIDKMIKKLSKNLENDDIYRSKKQLVECLEAQQKYYNDDKDFIDTCSSIYSYVHGNRIIRYTLPISYLKELNTLKNYCNKEGADVLCVL